MSDDAPKKSHRHWIELSQVIAMPLVTLIVGYVLNSSLNVSQTRDSNVRLYADMMGRREEADSALRKDMFKSILDTFVQKAPGQSQPDPESQVLNLELLAYNFHESLDLGPLFKHVQRQLTRSQPQGVAQPSRESLLYRLERVAEEVKERQLAAISESGMVERGELDVTKAGSTAWSLGRSAIQLKAGEMRGGATLCLGFNVAEMGATDETTTHYRQFRIEFLDFAPDRREVELSLAVSKPLAKDACQRIQDFAAERANLETEAQFWVGSFGFPMIDNTRLSRSERCSISVIRILENSVTVAISYFPASRASLKDKPYYDEVLQDLLRKNPSAAGK